MTGLQPSLRQVASHRDQSSTCPRDKVQSWFSSDTGILAPTQLLPTAHLEYPLDITIHGTDTKCTSVADIKRGCPAGREFNFLFICLTVAISRDPPGSQGQPRAARRCSAYTGFGMPARDSVRCAHTVITKMLSLRHRSNERVPLLRALLGRQTFMPSLKTFQKRVWGSLWMLVHIHHVLLRGHTAWTLSISLISRGN